MPSNFPTKQELDQQTQMLQRMANAGYAGIPTGGPSYGMVDNNQVALPQQAPLQAMAGQPPMNPAMQQERVLRQLGQGGNASGFKTQKMSSAIPLNAVFQNANHEFNVHAEPMASGNKYRGINGEVSAPFGEGELSVQGGYGRMFGVNKSQPEIEIGARYTRGFASGGYVDGQSLVEPIAENTQAQINTMMANGGLASTSRQDLSSFAKGGSVKDKLRSEFEKRGLDFEKFLNTTAGSHHAAQTLQQKGQNGDTILAHINPREAAMLKQMGGSGRINPETGLMSFDDWGDYGGGWIGSSDPIGGSIGGSSDWGTSYGGIGDYSSSYINVPGYTPSGSYTIDVPGYSTNDYTVPSIDYGSYGTQSDYGGGYDPTYGQTPGGDYVAPTPVDTTPAPSIDYGTYGTQSDYSGSGGVSADNQTNFPVLSGDTTPSNAGYFNDQQAAQQAAQEAAAQQAAAQQAAAEQAAAEQAAAEKAAAEQAAAEKAAAEKAAAEKAAAEQAAAEAARVEAARIAAETAANQQTANVDSLTSGLGLNTPAAYANTTTQDAAQAAAAAQQPIQQTAQTQAPASAANSLASLAATLLGISPAAAATMPTESNVGNRENTNSSLMPGSQVMFGENPDLASNAPLANLYNFYQAGTSGTGPSGFGPNPQVGPANNFTTPYYPSAIEAQGMNPMGSQGEASKGYYSHLDALGNPVSIPAGQNSLYISGQGPQGQTLDQSYMTGQPTANQGAMPLNVEVVNARDIPNLPPMPGQAASNPVSPTVERNYPMTPEARAFADQMVAQNAAEADQRALQNVKGLGNIADRVLGEGTTQSILNKVAESLKNQQAQTVDLTNQTIANKSLPQSTVDQLNENVARNQAAINAFTGEKTAENTTPSLARSTTITTIPQPNITPPDQVAQIPIPPIAPEGLRDNSIVDKITNSLTNKVNDIVANPYKYAINAGASLIPGLGLVNTLGGITGLYPTLGELGQTVATGAGGTGGKGSTGGLSAKDDAEIAAAINAGTEGGGGKGTVLPNGWTSVTPVTPKTPSGGGGGGSGTVPTGGTVPTQGTPVGPLSNRKFAGNANDLKRYGYGKEHEYYTYSAKGGKVSPLNAMRKA